MSTESQTQNTHTTPKIIVQDFIPEWANQFYIAKKVEGLSPYTLIFYRQQLNHFLKFCDSQMIKNVQDITSNDIRGFLLWLENSGHNQGGKHGAFRSLRAFLNFYENELEPEGWKNPIHKIKPPKVSLEPLDPVELDTVKSLIKTCQGHSFTSDRDKAIFLSLLDTGLRAREFISVNLSDFNQMTGEILLRIGKGKKSRFVYLSQTTRKVIRRYLKNREDNNQALWVTQDGERLSYGGLRGIITRRAILANIKCPSLHSFRRAFALNCLTNGMDIFTLQKLMGHSDLSVLRRYLKQTDGNLKIAHDRFSPVDNLE